VGTGGHWEALGGTGRQEKAVGEGLGGTGRDWEGLEGIFRERDEFVVRVKDIQALKVGTGRDWEGLGGTGRHWEAGEGSRRGTGGHWERVWRTCSVETMS